MVLLILHFILVNFNFNVSKTTTTMAMMTNNNTIPLELWANQLQQEKQTESLQMDQSLPPY